MNINNLNFRKITYPNIPVNRYYISENGILYDSLNKRFPKSYFDKDGYIRYTINHKHYSAHRLVGWEYLVDTRNINLVIDHLDGNKQNNDYRNLEWISSKENTYRAINNGLRNNNGENNPLSKHKEKNIRYIFELMTQGKSNQEIVQILLKNKYDQLSLTSEKNLYFLICRLRQGYLWNHIGKEYNFPRKVKVKPIFIPRDSNLFNIDQIHYICKLGRLNVRISYILKQLNINKENPYYRSYYYGIERILTGKNWTHISKMYNLPNVRINNYLNIDNEFLNELISKNLSEEDILEIFYYYNNKDKEILRNIIKEKLKIIEKNRLIKSNKDIKFSKICS